ncbi:nitroreductase family protein [Desulfobaculum bizertense]|uniref:Nitroreductase n=1 Tax=Desulfobaculum bizertense DSM 18034 TaxID=1121442 RepID=A0A1T4VEV0_9BACT|nr:nitroreductase family protein [Desulfobaculum bizertense]UIJ37682.1 nitroreductase family protein [Desulfobaculum bizertense]SKA63482.1 Nitroreductase [Desulfobaculum bizertense DSM 18034]
MDIFETLHTRRSIRKFTGEDVSDEQVQELLKAAMDAPSAGNQQPWHFIVVRDREILTAIEGWHPYSKMLRKASLAIIVCADKSLEKYKDYWPQDCSAATLNILLAARGMELGAVWCGIYPMEDRMKGASEMFKLPESVVPLSLIPIGVPDQPSRTVDRFREDRIHLDRW